MNTGKCHPHSDLSKPDLELDLALRDLGVDDLTKFRIVQYLDQNPSSVAEAKSFAATLGFHSTELTEVALSELSQRGILDQQSAPGQADRYGLAADSTKRRRVVELVRGTVGSADYEGLLQNLSRRSLAHARDWASKKEKENAASHPPGIRATIAEVTRRVGQRHSLNPS